MSSAAAAVRASHLAGEAKLTLPKGGNVNFDFIPLFDQLSQIRIDRNFFGVLYPFSALCLTRQLQFNAFNLLFRDDDVRIVLFVFRRQHR